MASNFSLLDSDSQVSAASDSNSLPSEPPDIRKWFSSYVYETPELNSLANLDVRISLNENDCDHLKYNVEDNNEGNEGNLAKQQTIRKEAEFVVDESHGVSSNRLLKCKNSSEIGNSNSESQVFDSSYSLISSEYDIKNWFSSYKYESPICSTSEEQFVISELTEREYDTYDNQHPCEDDPSVSNCLPSETVPKKVEGARISVNNDIILLKNDENPIETVKIACVELKRKSHEEISSLSSPKTDSHTSRMLSGDGFICMKRNKNNENFVQIPVNNRRIKLNAERKILYDKTNFQHDDALGVTGKWQCPQKGKPNLGPPLKQLRLEQWLRRK